MKKICTGLASMNATVQIFQGGTCYALHLIQMQFIKIDHHYDRICVIFSISIDIFLCVLLQMYIGIFLLSCSLSRGIFFSFIYEGFVLSLSHLLCYARRCSFQGFFFRIHIWISPFANLYKVDYFVSRGVCGKNKHQKKNKHKTFSE